METDRFLSKPIVIPRHCETSPLFGDPAKAKAFVGRGKVKTQTEFSACRKCSVVSCSLTMWQSVSYHACSAPLASLKEGGKGVWNSKEITLDVTGYFHFGGNVDFYFVMMYDNK